MILTGDIVVHRVDIARTGGTAIRLDDNGRRIVEDRGSDRYCPDDSFTRGQAAAFLRRALGLP